MKKGNKTRKKVCFLGNFGSTNFGNEITLQAILYHFRSLLPEAKAACVCSDPETLAATRLIEAVAICERGINPSKLRSQTARLLRKVFIRIPSEFYRWIGAFRTLKGTDMLIIPGTGLVTDAYGLYRCGPYDLFKWTLMAKLRGCKVLFVSVGVGPLYGAFGRHLVRSALFLADFRSYRDHLSMQCVNGIGLRTNSDRVYPDLVFSLPETRICLDHDKNRVRSVVGLGLMEYAGRYSVANPSNATYTAYLENLVSFAKWLLTHGYDVRLLVGDLADRVVTREFKSLLKERMGTYDQARVIDEPVSSPDQLLSQIAHSDIVVATRFHNALLALLLNKPVIAISFHHKCTSLMSEMGLAEYCHDINQMNAARLIEQFQDLEKNAERLRPLIRQKVEQARKALDEQYHVIFKML